MRWISSAAINFAALSTITLFSSNNNTNNTILARPESETVVAKFIRPSTKDDNNKRELVKLSVYSNSISTYARQNNYNTKICFLLDMKLPSGRNRFFVYDMQKNTILNEGLVAHGTGSDTGGSDLYFSNTPNSNCTSLGKYKIGVSYNGEFGVAYKLHGLDNTNNKAFERFIVLHSHACVPDSETEPNNICRSWGCPTVAPSFFNTVRTYLDKTDKPVLMWIFY